MAKHKCKPNRETLYRMYVEERCILKDIAEAYNTSLSGATNLLKAAHIKLRTMSESQTIRRERYNEKFTELEGVDHEETIKRFGYDPINISRKSEKLIVVVCPECHKSRVIMALGYHEGQLCKSCSKMRERHPIWGKHSAMLGKHHTEESKRKDSNSRKGKYTGKSNHNYGKPLAESTKEKLRIAMSGENNSNWKGGYTPHDYCHLWTESLRESIRDKYDRKCFLCGKDEAENGQKLSVHHVNHGKMCMCSYDCELVPLCKSCHGKVGMNRFYWFSIIMRKLYLESSAMFLADMQFGGA